MGQGIPSSGVASRWVAVALLAVLCLSEADRAWAELTPHATRAAAIGHVFVIVLENEAYEETFSAQSPAPYLAQVLPKQGVLLTQYFGTAHYSLPNYLAMISGQAANVDTRDDCTVFSDFVEKGVAVDGQVMGRGCVYPAHVKTLVQQLAHRHKTWRAYMEDMGNDPKRESATCGSVPLNQPDQTQTPEAPSARVPLGDQYAARHNPFVYFHSIVDSPLCRRHVVNLKWLQQDLKNIRTTAHFSFISPNLCHDGHDTPCVTGEPGGLASADEFLRTWVPRIVESPADQTDGVLVILFDEGDVPETANPAGGHLQAYPGAVCCAQQPGPNLGDFPQVTHWQDDTITFENYGGDRTGAVLLSPFLVPGTVAQTPFNHYSFLKSIERAFGISPYLGYAAQPGLIDFFACQGSDVQTVKEFVKECGL